MSYNELHFQLQWRISYWTVLRSIVQLHREVTGSLLLCAGKCTYLTFLLSLLVSAGAIDQSPKWRNGEDNTRTAWRLGKGNFLFWCHNQAAFAISQCLSVVTFLSQIFIFVSLVSTCSCFPIFFWIFCNEIREAHMPILVLRSFCLSACWWKWYLPLRLIR